MIRIGSRGSKLAVWQANWVAERIKGEHPTEIVQIKTFRTSGDKFTGHFSSQSSIKGLFVKEIESALLEGEIDLAVHSMKDLPTEVPDGLGIRVIPVREDPRDVLIARSPGMSLQSLPAGARIGTGSPRRGAQLMYFRPDLEIVPLRGNLDTRLRKLQTENLDAIILAFAGLRRLELDQRVSEVISPSVIMPAVAQGALGLEIRESDGATFASARFLHDPVTAVGVEAERAFLRSLGGGCRVPIAAHAAVGERALHLEGCVTDPSGKDKISGARDGDYDHPTALGEALAAELIERGAEDLLD